jgi:hypothetical protein
MWVLERAPLGMGVTGVLIFFLVGLRLPSPDFSELP